MLRRITLLALALCIMLSTGCSLLSGTSGGGRTTSVPSDELSSFIIRYRNWTEFDRDLTVSVDNLLSRLRAEDSAVKSALRAFLQPAEDLLSHRYGIVLNSPEPLPLYEGRKFTLNTSFGSWHPVSDESPLLKVARTKGKVSGLRCRGRIRSAEAEFNLLTPKKVFISADLVIQMQAYEPIVGWSNIEFKSTAINNLGNQLRRELNATYRDYLRDRYGLMVAASGVGGQDEK